MVFSLYLAITAVGSSRNYGLRYLLPLAPLAIVWISALGETCRTISTHVAILARSAVAVGLAGYLVAIAGIHPHELTYFNALGGGARGGRRILADSNLDWGQGLKSLARLQRQRPEFADITLYYFGDTEPAHYGVKGRSQVITAIDDYSKGPGLVSAETPYLAVSASTPMRTLGALPVSSMFLMDWIRSGLPTIQRSRSTEHSTCTASPSRVMRFPEEQ